MTTIFTGWNGGWTPKKRQLRNTETDAGANNLENLTSHRLDRADTLGHSCTCILRFEVDLLKDTPFLSPELLLHGYSVGIFPMAESRDDPEVFWVDPKKRGILPLDGFHLSRSLARDMRRTHWHYTKNEAFDAVLSGCADRAETWINEDIAQTYTALFERGRAHSFEVWNEETLIGGVYGVTLGAAFFGESMFSRQTNASKMALAGCVDLLSRAGFTLFDTQFITPHLASLGGVEIPRAQYHILLEQALKKTASFQRFDPTTPAEVCLRLAQ